MPQAAVETATRALSTSYNRTSNLVWRDQATWFGGTKPVRF